MMHRCTVCLLYTSRIYQPPDRPSAVYPAFPDPIRGPGNRKRGAQQYGSQGSQYRNQNPVGKQPHAHADVAQQEGCLLYTSRCV